MNKEIEEYFSRSRDLLLIEAEETSVLAQEILEQMSKTEASPEIQQALKLTVESISFATKLLRHTIVLAKKDASLLAAEGCGNAAQALSKIREMVLNTESSEIMPSLILILSSLEAAHKAALLCLDIQRPDSE